MLTRALVQALSSPIGGLLGDRMDRTHIVAFGCVLWGAMTAGIGLSHTLTQVCLAPSASKVSRWHKYPEILSALEYLFQSDTCTVSSSTSKCASS